MPTELVGAKVVVQDGGHRRRGRPAMASRCVAPSRKRFRYDMPAQPRPPTSALQEYGGLHAAERQHHRSPEGLVTGGLAASIPKFRLDFSGAGGERHRARPRRPSARRSTTSTSWAWT